MSIVLLSTLKRISEARTGFEPACDGFANDYGVWTADT
jgi:hypothetical protein